MPKPENPIDRKQRLAEALRQNLKRRKAQGRERAAAAARQLKGGGPAPDSGKSD